MHRCPCGFSGSRGHACTDRDADVQRYRARLWPLLERMDLVVPIEPAAELGNAPFGESSVAVRERIAAAHLRQRWRLSATPWTRNAELPADALERLCPLTPEARAMLDAAALDAGLALRLRRIARTISDLDPDRDPAAPIDVEAMGSALELRPARPLDLPQEQR